MENKKFGYFEYIKSKKMVFLYLAIILLASILIFRLFDPNNPLTGNSVKITGEAIRQEQISAEKDKLIKAPIEVKEKRDYTSQTYKNPDGTYTAVIGARPQFFFNGSEFTEIEKISQPRIEKKEIVLNKKPTNNIFDFGTYNLAEGINASIDLETQELILRDVNNNIMQVLPRPFSIDKNNNTLFNNYKISQKKQKLTISVNVDKIWLDNAEYPVVIDPTTITILTNTYMGNVYPVGGIGGGYYKRSSNGSTIGADCTFGEPNTCETYRTFIEFDTTAIPDSADINDTILNISVSSRTFCSGESEIHTNITRFNNSRISDPTNYSGTNAGNLSLFNNISTGYKYLGSYASDLNYTEVGKEFTRDLGTKADEDLKSQLGNNFFALGVYTNQETSTLDCIHTVTFNDSAKASGYPKLMVNYTSAACVIPPNGDWNCNASCIFTNENLKITGGDLVIRDQCNLTLNASTNLTLASPGRYILVYSGGQIFIHNGSGINRRN
ncbi:hypothetical protein HYW74_02725 [Candidatus Pacearchaeota archaeon]|nr:hypothetical protein [Candidatus Pacearchaeota archaeon]